MEGNLEGHNRVLHGERRTRKNNEGVNVGNENNNAEGNLEMGHAQKGPRIVIDLPPWMGQLTGLSRGLKMLLMTVVIVAAIGSVVIVSMRLPYLNSESSGEAESRSSSSVFSAATSPTTMSDILSHSTNTDAHSYGAHPPVSASDLMRPEMVHFANVDSVFDKDHHIPFFLHIPRSDGSKFMAIMGKCMGLVQVTHLSINNKGKPKDPDDIFTQSLPLSSTKIGTVLDMDTYSLGGLRAAAQGNLLSDPRLHVLDSPLPYDAARTIFHADDNNREARLFVLLQHPVERVISYFYHHVQPSSTANNLSLRNYAEQPVEQPEFNYLTKILANRPLLTPSQDLTVQDVHRAKQVLRQKVLVGLLDERYKEKSVQRFMEHFHWSLHNIPNTSPDYTMCQTEVPQWYRETSYDYTQIGTNDDRWALVLKRNLHDMDLYEYAKNILFEEQGRMSPSSSDRSSSSSLYKCSDYMTLAFLLCWMGLFVFFF